MRQKDYDDMMMANIELKSQDFESPNYTVLFGRKKKESFIGFSDRHKSDLAKVGLASAVPRDIFPGP